MGKIITLISGIKGDIRSCFFRAFFLLLDRSSAKRVLFVGVIIVFIITVFKSESLEGFYLQVLQIVSISLLTFLIFVQSDTFWFLIVKSWVYQAQIKSRKSIQELIYKNHKLEIGQEGLGRSEIYYISRHNSNGYKYHVKRVGAELVIFMVILLVTNPLFFFFNVLLFFAMLFYVGFYENQCFDQAIVDVAALTASIEELYKKDKGKCKNFILRNKENGVRELREIYHVVDHYTNS